MRERDQGRDRAAPNDGDGVVALARKLLQHRRHLPFVHVFAVQQQRDEDRDRSERRHDDRTLLDRHLHQQHRGGRLRGGISVAQDVDERLERAGRGERRSYSIGRRVEAVVSTVCAGVGAALDELAERRHGLLLAVGVAVAQESDKRRDHAGLDERLLARRESDEGA